MVHVLVVDPEPEARQHLMALLGPLAGVRLTATGSGGAALATAQADPPGIVVTEVDAPDLDGLALCRALRADPALAPAHVIFVTKRAAANERYEAFLSGADDYVPKPFDPLELQFRVKARLRCLGAAAARALAAGGVTLDAARSTACVADLEVPLTASEFAILRHLVLRPDRLIGVGELLAGPMGYPPGVGAPHVIHTHVRNIRAKFRARGLEPTFLASTRQGYMLATRGG